MQIPAFRWVVGGIGQHIVEGSGRNLRVCLPQIAADNVHMSGKSVFFGIFLGGWILALAEIAKVFPVFVRRIKLSPGMSLVILSIAAGKTLGSLLYYAQGWM